MKKENLRPFTLSELWAGGGGMKCGHESGCNEPTFTLYLSHEEVKKLNKALPVDICPGDSIARGPNAAAMIIQRNFGVALCKNHTPEHKS